MKSKSIKKLLTAALVATMLVGSTLSVCATGGNPGTGGDGGSTSDAAEETSEETSEEAAEATVSEVAAEVVNGEETSAPVTPAVSFVSADGNVSVAGMAVKTTVAGAIKVDSVQGLAVTTPLAEVKASLGLTGSQTPFIIAFDTNAKKSNLAMDCVNAAAESLGGQVVTAINVTLGAKENGKLISLSNGSAGMVVGLPKNVDTSKTYSVVCVQPGGVVTILNDQDSNPATVTFAVKAGLGTYGIVSK